MSPDPFAMVADLYDAVGPYQERGDIPFFVEEALAAQGEVLELGCGTGRLLIPSAVAGATMTGLDLSEPMLNICRQKLTEENPATQARVRLQQGNMIHFSFPQRFALITLPFQAFQFLLKPEEAHACLQAIRYHLQPQGRVIFDLFDPALAAYLDEEHLKKVVEDAEVVLPHGVVLGRSQRILYYEPEAKRIDFELIYHRTFADCRQETLLMKHLYAMLLLN